jgi:hypothetical protein
MAGLSSIRMQALVQNVIGRSEGQTEIEARDEGGEEPPRE